MAEAAPTSRELAACLRRAAESARREGDSCGWAPVESSEESAVWARAESDALARSLVEADVSAALLVRSALEHTLAVADSISRGHSFVPHSVGRSAVEHALRAAHLLDDQATDVQRVARRLNDWMYALDEAEQLREGIVEAGHPGAEQLQSEEPMRVRVRERAATIGLTVTPNGKRVAEEKRPSTLKLAETYLSGDGGGGLPSWLMRCHAAMDHGLETGLLSAIRDTPGPGGVNVMAPEPMPSPRMAFELMGVPLAVWSAYRLLRYCYGWSDDSSLAETVVKEQERSLVIWSRGVTAYLDEVAPERLRTGIVSIRPFGQPRGGREETL